MGQIKTRRGLKMGAAFTAVPAFLAVLAFISGQALQAQATGTILGTVSDSSGAIVPGATVTVTNKATGAIRNTVSNSDGQYSAPALLAGSYEVGVDMQGFSRVLREAQVLAGTNTTVDFNITPGQSKEVINVEAATAQISYDSNTVQGSVERQSIQSIPLNGRNFMQLASLEPGTVVSPGPQSEQNHQISINILGGGIGYTLITLDGLRLTDQDDGSSNVINFSQEMVEEFQLSTVNFDLSGGYSAGGIVNIVSRSGGNNFHGSGFFFYRDHNIAAYPSLKRSSFDPNPFFARRNPGAYVSGPILKDKLFFFFNYEYQNQVQVIPSQQDLAAIAGLSQNVAAPGRVHYLNARFDYRLSDKHTLFARYTHDGNFAFGPYGKTDLPSNWQTTDNWADQSVLGVTSTLTPSLVNDLRFQYLYWRMNAQPVPVNPQYCPSPCIGAGLPQTFMLGSATFGVGNNFGVPQLRSTREYQIADTLSWQKGSHRFRWGGDFDWWAINLYWQDCAPACLEVYSPTTALASAGALGPTLFGNLPSTISSNADILALPVYNLPTSLQSGVAVGQGFQPGPYHQSSGQRNLRPHLFIQDTWKVRPSLTVNYGLAWEANTGLFNSDMRQPAILAPIYGANDLHPTPVNWLDFSPSLGFAWSPGHSGKTVIRGGAGLYWDIQPIWYKNRETALIGPPGNSEVEVPADAFTNSFPGIVQVIGGQSVPLPVGAALPIATLTNMTLGQFLQIYNQQIGAITQKINPPNVQTTGAYSVSELDILKTGSELIPPNAPLLHSYQTSIGIQRDLGHDMVLTADYARRQGVHTLVGEVDVNHYSEFINGVQTPAIPKCTQAQLFDASQLCSVGGMSTLEPEGRSVYEGLLVKLQKRFSSHYQFLASYALQNLNANTSVVDLNNWFQSYGHQLPRQNLNVSGLIQLPFGFELSVNSSIISRTPVMAVTTGVDLTGTLATASTPIPGLSYNCLGLTCGKTALASAVAQFNSTYAGQKTPNGTIIPSYVLPPDYQFGDPVFSQDFRVTKNVVVKERYRFSIYGEIFNAFNIANLSGYTFSLDAYNAAKCGPLAAGAVTTTCAAQTYAFGQPTQRSPQAFLSSGPRAFQFGARFSF